MPFGHFSIFGCPLQAFSIVICQKTLDIPDTLDAPNAGAGFRVSNVRVSPSTLDVKTPTENPSRRFRKTI